MFYSSTIALYGNKSKCYYPQKKSFKLSLPKDRLYSFSCDRVFQQTPSFESQREYLFHIVVQTYLLVILVNVPYIDGGYIEGM